MRSVKLGITDDSGDFDQKKRNIMKLFNDDLLLNFLPDSIENEVYL